MKKAFKERFVEGYKKTRGLSWVILIIAGIAGVGMAMMNEEITYADLVDKYLNQDIKDINVEENLAHISEEIGAIIGECMEKRQNNEEIAWDDVEGRMDPLLQSLKTDKDKISELTIEDEKLSQANQYLVTSYEQMIKGYEDMIAGMKMENMEQVLESQNILLASQDNISKWQGLLNE